MSLSIEEFGAELIATGDLDPIYIALWNTEFDIERHRRILLGYWMFYHLGVAAWLSEQDDFWSACFIAALNDSPSPLGGRWPRGTERRHFRGKACIKAIDWLRQEDPEYWLGQLCGMRTLEQVSDFIEPWPLFGDWIAYKIADMLERCVGVPIKMSSDVCLLYKAPRESLLARAPDAPEKELARLQDNFSAYLAPPANDRHCSFQETETILCKHASYLNRRYWVGKDIHEVRAHLLGWGTTAGLLLEAMPSEVGDGLFCLSNQK